MNEEIRNPYNGEVVGRAPVTDEAGVRAAIGRAVEAFESTRRLSAYRRRNLLRAVAEGIRARADELADLICAEAGKPIAFARGEVSRAVTTFTLAAEELS